MSLFIYHGVECAAPLETFLFSDFLSSFLFAYLTVLLYPSILQRKRVQPSPALSALSFDIQIYANPAAVSIKCSSQTLVVMGANMIG